MDRLWPAPSLLFDSKQAPLAGDTLEGVEAAVDEAQARASYEVFHRTGDPHLARSGKGRHTSADVHSDPTNLIADQLDLAAMEAGSDVEAERADRFKDSTGAPDSARWPVKGDEHTVTGPVDLTPAGAGEFPPYSGAVTLE